MDSSCIEQFPLPVDGLEEVRVFDGPGHDQVDRSLEELFEFFQQAEVGVCPLAGFQGKDENFETWQSEGYVELWVPAPGAVALLAMPMLAGRRRRR